MTVREVVERAMNAAYENGYGAEIEALDADELAEDIHDYDADAEGFDLADLAAVIREIRSTK